MIVTTGVDAFVHASILKFGVNGYGFFHLFIVVGFVSSVLGVFGLYQWRRTRERRWLRMHQMRFSFSYAGLLMAGLSQVATNSRFGIVTELTPATFWTMFFTLERPDPRYRDRDRPPLPRGRRSAAPLRDAARRLDEAEAPSGSSFAGTSSGATYRSHHCSTVERCSAIHVSYTESTY